MARDISQNHPLPGEAAAKPPAEARAADRHGHPFPGAEGVLTDSLDALAERQRADGRVTGAKKPTPSRTLRANDAPKSDGSVEQLPDQEEHGVDGGEARSKPRARMKRSRQASADRLAGAREEGMGRAFVTDAGLAPGTLKPGSCTCDRVVSANLRDHYGSIELRLAADADSEVVRRISRSALSRYVVKLVSVH